MGSSWKNLRNLFWQSGEPAADSETELSDEEFAALLSDSPHAVPPGAEPAGEPIDLGTVRVEGAGAGLRIDFQAQYDAAGIPNSDEVEKLEDFLSRLDPKLPTAAKIAAAEAFLGAIGKARTDVLTDAERKISRVRGLMQAKLQETDAALRKEQSTIDELAAKIETHKQRMLEITQALEAFRHACVVEESRLQGARVFFGNAGQPSSSGGSESGPR